MASAACDEEGNLIVIHSAGEALIVVGMAGEDCMWPYSCCFAGGVYVLQHAWTASVYRASGK